MLVYSRILVMTDKYGNEIARVLRGIGDLPLTTPTDESDIHST